MANDKNLNINIVAKDKTQQALQSAQTNLQSTKNSVINLKNALVSLGAGLVLKSFVDVGNQVENLQVRLKFLFGSAKEGARAFDEMAKFAGKVPFSLEEIQQGAGVLSVVSKDADELAKIMEITGNVAAVSGLDFRTASEQIQRSLSAGINAADLFRERGVREMLGFKAGATVSIEETRDALIKVFGPDGEFAGATDDLANTLQGTLSMIGDKYFNFQKQVAEEFFDELKKEFGDLDKALAENEDVIRSVAEATGRVLAGAITKTADAFRFINENIEEFKKIGLTVAIFATTKAMAGLTIAVGRTTLAFMTMSKVSRTTFIGFLAAAGFAIASFTGHLDKMFAIFNKPKGFEELRMEAEMLRVSIDALDDSLDPNFTRVQMEASNLKRQMRQLLETLDPTTEEFRLLKEELDLVNEALENIEFGKITIETEKLGGAFQFLKDSAGEFKEGFKEAMDKDVFSGFQKAGETAFKSLKKMLTDFVITGKMNMNDFKRAVSTAIIEALIGEAVSAAISKAKTIFKMDAIKKALINVYEAGTKALASVPPPFNFALAGAVIAGGLGMVNKIRGFEKGGRPTPGQVALVGEKGPELFVPDSAGTVIPNNQLKGETNVNITIMANDTEGFDNLLIKRRSTIINVINDALNSQGREAII